MGGWGWGRSPRLEHQRQRRRKEIDMRYALVVLAMAFARVAPAGEEFSGFGMSQLSCARYISDLSANARFEAAYSWWVAGFVTGANLAKGRVVSTDNEAHIAWLKQYCQAHPSEPFADAAVELDRELDSKHEK
jgi:hypothetical protein